MFHSVFLVQPNSALETTACDPETQTSPRLRRRLRCLCCQTQSCKTDRCRHSSNSISFRVNAKSSQFAAPRISSNPGLTKSLALGNCLSVRCRNRSNCKIIGTIDSARSGTDSCINLQPAIDRSIPSKATLAEPSESLGY